MRQLVRILLVSLVSSIATSVSAQAPQPTAAADAGTTPDLPGHFEKISVRDTVQRDGRIVRVMEAEIVVRDAVGVSQFGQIGTAYTYDFEEVVFDRIAVAKPDGRRVEVTNGKVEDLNPFGLSDGPLPADVRVRRLTIPGLEPGDRFSYRMTVTRKPLVPNVPWGEFKFVVGPGVREQSYELDIP